MKYGEKTACWITADTHQLLKILKLKPEEAAELAYKHWKVMPIIELNIADKKARKTILIIEYTVPLLSLIHI